MTRPSQRARHWLRSAQLAAVAVAALVSGCDSQQAATPAARTDLDQQVSRLREDNEKELTDIRGKWLAAESQLVKMGRDFEALSKSNTAAIEAAVARIDRLETTLTDARAELLAVRSERAAPAPVPVDPSERLLRAYEELLCGRRAGTGESVAQIYARWGFETADDWAEAWQSASQSEAFERSVSARIARLCP
jgi:hypothetical protein